MCRLPISGTLLMAGTIGSPSAAPRPACWRSPLPAPRRSGQASRPPCLPTSLRARCVRSRAVDADRRHLGRHGDHAAGWQRRRYRSREAGSAGLRAGNLQCPGSGSLPRTQDQLVPALRKQAARRTAGLPLKSFDDIRRHEQWFRNRIAETALDGVILDYDGTVVDTKARQLPPTESTVAALAAVLERGVVLGIATGRGGSVGDDLRTVLPRAVWPQVFVGYYNGGACLPLVEPLNKESILEDAAFAGLVREVRANPAVANWLEDVKLQRVQVSFIPRRGIGLAALRTAGLEAAGRLRLAGYTALNSSHSVDVLAPTVSKLNLLEFLRSRLGFRALPFCVWATRAPGRATTMTSWRRRTP